jgi:hypothetical protein
MVNSAVMPTPLRDFRLMMMLFSLAFLGLMIYFLFTKISDIQFLVNENSDSNVPS